MSMNKSNCKDMRFVFYGVLFKFISALPPPTHMTELRNQRILQMKDMDHACPLAQYRPKTTSQDQLSTDSQTAPSLSPSFHIQNLTHHSIVLYGIHYILDCSCWQSLQSSLKSMEDAGVTSLTSLSIATIVLQRESKHNPKAVAFLERVLTKYEEMILSFNCFN